MGYRFPKTTMDDLLNSNKVIFGSDEQKIVELKVYAHEYQEKLSSVLELDGRLGAYDLRTLFPLEGKIFSNPKPVRLLTTILPFLLRSDGDIVMDFFAGSGTTASAILGLNHRDSVRRRYILVQLPQPLDPSTQGEKTAADLCDKISKPRNIAELTKERLRRAGRKIKAENPGSAADLGFRVFKMDSSNVKTWEPEPDDLEQALLDHLDHIKEDRSEQDILYELLLKRGLDLCAPTETRELAAKQAYAVADGELLACLAERIEPAGNRETVHGHRRLDQRVGQCQRRHGGFPR